MSLNIEGNQTLPQADYLKVRVFLYKYTPPFIPPSGDLVPPRSENLPTTGLLAAQARAAQDVRLYQDIASLKSTRDTINGFLGRIAAAIGTFGNQGNSSLTSEQASAFTLLFRQAAVNYIIYQFQPPTTGSNNSNAASAQSLINLNAPTFSELQAIMTAGAGAPPFPSKATGDLKLLSTYLHANLAAANRGVSAQGKTASAVNTAKAQAAKATRIYDSQTAIARFSCPLDPAYFSRFEITSFLHNYTVTQSMKDMGNSLSIELLNDIVSYKDLDVPPSVSPASPSSFLSTVETTLAAPWASTSSPRRVRRPTYFPAKKSASAPYLDEYTSQSNAYDRNPRLSGDGLITNIAQYFTETATEFNLDSLRTEIAMRIRGVKDPTRKLAIQQRLEITDYNLSPDTSPQFIRSTFRTFNEDTSYTDSGADGILLSDLIQKFDMISVIVYKWPFPPNLVEQSLIKKAVTWEQANLFDIEPLMFACPISLLPTTQPATKASGEGTIPLYESEFLGFVSNISFSYASGQSAPTVKLEGKGVSSLLASSRRIYAATALQQGIYAAGELPNVDSGILLQNTLQNEGGVNTTPLDVLKVLLREFYHIKFYPEKTRVIGQDTSAAVDFSTPASAPLTVKSGNSPTCYIDIREMEYNNNVASLLPPSKTSKRVPPKHLAALAEASKSTFYQLPTSSINGSQGSTSFLCIPSYLYALVMQMRKFNVQVLGEPTPRLYPTNADAVGDSPLVVNASLLNTSIFTAYFTRMSDTLGAYNPTNKTPLEIIDEIRTISYLEFFETPGGRLVFRTPQYNNITKITSGISIDTNGNALMVDSSQIIPISFDYTDTKDQLISGIQMSTSVHIMPDVIPMAYPRYVNGKVLAQYGFMVPQPYSNPNAIPRTTNPSNELPGMFEFCRFFYEYGNALLKNGTISYVGSSQIQVGQTFFDLSYQKFGYVTSVVKRAEVGGSYVASASLSMVRNAMPILDTSIVAALGPSSTSIATSMPTFAPGVYFLPYLEALAAAFSGQTPQPTDATPLRTSSAIADRTLALTKFVSAFDSKALAPTPSNSPTVGVR